MGHLKKAVAAGLILLSMAFLMGCGGKAGSMATWDMYTGLEFEDDTETAQPAGPAVDYNMMVEERKTEILLSGIWVLASRFDESEGLRIVTKEDLVGQERYIRFVDDKYMHEWSDTGTNLKYQWYWTKDNKLSCMDITDSKQKMSSFHFEGEYLAKEIAGRTAALYRLCTADLPAEPDMSSFSD